MNKLFTKKRINIFKGCIGTRKIRTLTHLTTPSRLTSELMLLAYPSFLSDKKAHADMKRGEHDLFAPGCRVFRFDYSDLRLSVTLTLEDLAVCEITVNQATTNITKPAMTKYHGLSSIR